MARETPQKTTDFRALAVPIAAPSANDSVLPGRTRHMVTDRNGAYQYNTWKGNFGATGSSPSLIENTAVPEPTTALLLMLALAGMCLRRR